MSTQHVLEYSKPSVRGNMIRGVKIIGRKSAHGWVYPTEVLAKAIPLYESAPVFISHPDPREKRQGSRLLRDHFGNLENVSGNGDGLYGDLNVKLSHPLAREILEHAPSATCGLSHNAVVEMSKDGKQVGDIVEVNSVDLVDDPATTKNLFEDQAGTFEEKMLAFMAKLEAHLQPAGATGKAVTEESSSSEILDRLVEEGVFLGNFSEEVKAAIRARPDSGYSKPVKRLTALEDKTGDEGDATPIGNDHEAFMGVVRGFSLK